MTLGLVLAVGLVPFVWGDVLTHTADTVVTTAKEVWPPLGGAHSVDASYSLLSGSGPSSQSILNAYRRETLHTRKVNGPATYLPLSKALSAPTPALDTSSLRVSEVGKLLADIHVPPSTVNTAVRDLASRGEQIFIVVGLAAIGLVRRRRRQVGRDFYLMAVASLAVLAAVTVLPGLSVSYGLLRVFQQALFILAPVLVIGSFVVLRPFGEAWAARIGSVLALVFLVSTIGVMPQILGVYPAQLNLNNSGAYYNNYYVHPQEVEAVRWLGGQPDTLPNGVQAENFTDLWDFKDPNDIGGTQVISDLYPTLVRKSTWVVLGYSIVHSDVATTDTNGDLIAYKYPKNLLSQNKNRVLRQRGDGHLQVKDEGHVRQLRIGLEAASAGLAYASALGCVERFCRRKLPSRGASLSLLGACPWASHRYLRLQLFCPQRPGLRAKRVLASLSAGPPEKHNLGGCGYGIPLRVDARHGSGVCPRWFSVGGLSVSQCRHPPTNAGALGDPLPVVAHGRHVASCSPLRDGMCRRGGADATDLDE